MFKKEQKLEKIIAQVKNDSSLINKLNYEQLTILIEYLTNYKNHLMKKKEDK